MHYLQLLFYKIQTKNGETNAANIIHFKKWLKHIILYINKNATY